MTSTGSPGMHPHLRLAAVDAGDPLDDLRGSGRAAGRRQGSDIVRRVPRATAVSGMALGAVPADTVPKVTTVGVIGSASRLTSCWAATMIWASGEDRVAGQVRVGGVPALAPTVSGTRRRRR